MKKRYRALLFIPLICLMLVGMPALAQSQKSAPRGAGYYLVPALPENQIDDSLGYFDLRVSPGMSQDIVVEIHNESDREIKVQVSANNATTNKHGVIDYTNHNSCDETQQTVFSDIARVKEGILKVGAGQSADATIHLQLPEEPFQGTILGGIVVNKIDETTEDVVAQTEEESLGIRNLYSYVVAVKLTETNVSPPPAFEQVRADIELQNYHTYAVHAIRNPVPSIIKDVVLDYELIPINGAQPVAKVIGDVVSFAPDSVMPYAAAISQERLEPGEYISHVHMELDGEEWDFEERIVVSADQSQEIADTAVQFDGADKQESWLPILFISMAVVIVILLVLLLKSKKKTERH